MPSLYDWSATAASNANSDGDINWAEGQLPSTVNNSARMMMKRIRDLLTDLGGSNVATGTPNAITITSAMEFTTLTNGRIIAFKAAADNTAATTLNVNLLGAKAIVKMGSAGESALAGSEIQGTGIYIVMYSTALNTGAGAWLLLNPSDVVTATGTQTLTNKTLTAPTINGGAINEPTLKLKGAAAPVPTVEGELHWDTDDDRMVAGSGSGQKYFSPNPGTTVDNTIARFDGVKGATQTSAIVIDDDGNLATNGAIAANGGLFVGGQRNGMVRATAQATVSGTAKEFTGIPAGVRRVTLMLAGVSLDQTALPVVLLGTSSGFETTGYQGTAGYTSSFATSQSGSFTASFAMSQTSASASAFWSGIAVLSLLDPTSNVWTYSWNGSIVDSILWSVFGAGSKALGGALSQIRFTTSSGIASFDAGLVNIMYEH